jgi:hypothetical protein
MRRLTNVLLTIGAIFLVGAVTACGSGSGSGALSSRSPSIPALSRGETSAGAAQPSTPSIGATTEPTTPSLSTPARTPRPTIPAPTPTPTTPVPTFTTTTVPATTPLPSASTSAPESTSSSTAVWLWVILGLVVILGAILWIVLARRRRSAASATAAWRSRVVDAYAGGAALHDAMSVAETPGARAAADADARWSDIQRRADALAETLYAMREAAPDEAERYRVVDVLATLGAVRSAMDAERAPTGAGERQAEVVRGRLLNFQASLRAFQASSSVSAASAAWRSRVIEAYAGGAALYDAISVAETPSALAATDAYARWFDIQRRADALAETLYAMREAAPDEAGLSRVVDVLATLHAVRSAMDAERAPTGATERQAEVVRGRMFDFEAALRAFQASSRPETAQPDRPGDVA